MSINTYIFVGCVILVIGLFSIPTWVLRHDQKKREQGRYDQANQR